MRVHPLLLHARCFLLSPSSPLDNLEIPRRPLEPLRLCHRRREFERVHRAAHQHELFAAAAADARRAAAPLVPRAALGGDRRRACCSPLTVTRR